ncbi:MAG: four helix bundle protein [Ruminococcus sp.]|nr:four helix bundle protein [Ruminococcus sp.]
MEKRFGSNNIYMLSRAWQWAQIVEYFMEPLANRIFDRDFDPGRRHFEQINMAARSVSANIAEGLSRCQTSSHTEMTLLDVASGSLSEISSDLLRNSFRNNVWFWDFLSN